MLQIVRLVVAGAVGIAVAAGLMVVATGPAQAAPGQTSEQLWREVEVFQYLHAVKLTADQAQQAAALVAPVAEQMAANDTRVETPEVLAAMSAIRSAALAGQPITEDMYKALTTAKAKAAAEWSDEATPTVWSSAAAAAAAVVALLDATQQQAIVLHDATQLAQGVVVGALGQADADAEGWSQWTSDTLGELSVTSGLAEASIEPVRALLDKLHALGTVDPDTVAGSYVSELAALLAASDSELDTAGRATEALSEMLVGHSEMAQCLAEYATAQRK